MYQKGENMKVKVRIAVAVDSSGNWSGAGWNDATDKEMQDGAKEFVEEGERMYWLVAELDTPEIQTITPAIIRA